MQARYERRAPWVDRRAALGLVAAGALAAAKPALALTGEGGSDAAAVAMLEALLERNLLPFWRRVADKPGGEGYHLNIDDAGQWLEPTNRPIIPQARTTWFFAHLARSRWAQAGDLARAQRGFDFLTRWMWDPDPAGGFFWEVDKATYQPTKPDKYLNGQAHALLALSEHALASGTDEARDWAEQVAEVIDNRLRDPEASDYFDFRNRDWSAPPPNQLGYFGLPPNVRAYNARFRLLDALTAYHELARTRRSRTRLREAIAIAERGLATEPAFYFRSTDPAPSAPRVSYAADLQTIHQLRRARALLGLAEPASYRRVIDDALRWGADRMAGGLHEGGVPGQPADAVFKYGWMQAEAFLATCDSWVRTGDAAHRAAFRRTLLWIARRQADWARGEWHYALGNGAPTGPKAEPFHTGRAVLRSLELLQARGPR